MAQQKKRGVARKAPTKRGRLAKRAGRTRMGKRVAAKTAPKKRLTKIKAKRTVTKKAPSNAPGPPAQKDDATTEPVPPAAEERVTSDVIAEPVSEATGVHGS